MNFSLRFKWLSFSVFIILFGAGCAIFPSGKIEFENYSISPAAQLPPADASLEQVISPYKEQMGRAMNEVIGHNKAPLFLERPESALGNFLADLLYRESLEYAGDSVDFTVLNFGGVRLFELPEGEITIGKMYEIMPFENRLVLLRIPSELVHRLADVIAADGGWPVSQNFRFEIVGKKAQNIRLDGESLQEDKIYTAALPDFIAFGNAGCNFFADLPRTETGHLVREIFISGIKKMNQQGQAVESKVDGRIILANH